MRTYIELKQRFKDQAYPYAFIDLEALDSNIKTIAEQLKQTRIKIRIATKSIRVPEVLKRLLSFGAPFSGLLCYSAHEIEFLAAQGFDDFWLAYPVVSKQELEALRRVHEQGKVVRAVVDCAEHVEALASSMQNVTRPFEVILDIDVGYTFLGIHLGVKRSPVRSVEQVLELAKKIAAKPSLKLVGVQAYEAHVAGFTDHRPLRSGLMPFLQNPVAFFLRRVFARDAAQKRDLYVQALRQAGFEINHVNGGGSGSISFNRHEKTITELGVGSGLLGPVIFDFYSNQKFKPALFFGLEVTRHPEKKTWTCEGGGYIASGASGKDRSPCAVLPRGGKFLSEEGAGEVQTPVHFEHLDEVLNLGDPIFFRPAKSGELAEHFKEYFLLEKNGSFKPSATYRGHGQCFY